MTKQLKVADTTIAVVYEETYGTNAARIRAEFRPTLPHITAKHTVVQAEVLRSGRLADGCEFQDLRVIVRLDS